MESLSFANEAELVLWLQTDAGAEVRKKIQLDRPPVVVETEAGGHVTVYADPSRVVCKVVARPTVRDSAATLADEAVELELTPFFRDVYWPGKVIGRGTCRERRPSEMARQLEARLAYETVERWGRGVCESSKDQRRRGGPAGRIEEGHNGA